MKDKEDLLAATSALSQDDLRIQLNTYDHYQSVPTILDRSHPPNHEDYSYSHVPIMRIFGSLTTGHRSISHVHGFFPYIYIPYDNQDCFKLHLNLENSVLQSFKRSKKDTTREDKVEDSKVFKYIANVSLCKGVPFYGYHVGYRAFYKISLLSPSCVNRVSEILRSGKIGKMYGVYESHISSGLQFLADFNLFGCGWIKITDMFIRIPVLYDDDKADDELIDLLSNYSTISLERIGNSDLEFDIMVQNIANRFELSQRELHSNFIEKFQSSANSSIYIQSTKDLWKDGDYQRRLKNEQPYSSPSPISRFNTPQKWVESETNESMFEYVKNLNLPKDIDLNFNNFVKDSPILDSIPKAFETVNELFFEPDLEGVSDSSKEVNVSGETEDHLSEEAIVVNDEYNQEIEQFENFDYLSESDDQELMEQSGDEKEEDEGDVVGELEEVSRNEVTGNDTLDFHFTQNFNAKFNKTFKHSLNINLSSQKASPIQNFNLKKINPQCSRFVYDILPPSELDFDQVGLPKIQYDDPFFMEAPPKPFIHGNRKFTLESKTLEFLKPATFKGQQIETPTRRTKRAKFNVKGFKKWRYIQNPPTIKELELELEATQANKPISQLNITQKFKFNTQKRLERRPDGSIPLSLMVMELFVPTRGDFKPDPAHDEIQAIVWSYSNGSKAQQGIFILNPKQAIPETNVKIADNEFDLIDNFVELVKQLDPDILSGYEVHSSSWGYMIDRSKSKHNFEIMGALSRVIAKGNNRFGDHWGATHTSRIQITGRHMLNIWRHLRELKLPRNNIEYVTFHLLHERLPYFSERTLTNMYEYKWFLNVLKHFVRKVDVDMRLIEAADLVVRASEEARLIGIDFYDVFYRGSQYKVESLMIRIAKAENFVLLSASKKQVRNQKALECIPLVMEPLSAFYKSPLVVLDFQSLYPSIIIAYNYCYSTLLGRLRNYKPNDFNQMGTTKIKHEPGLLKLLENDITLSPNGLMFVKSTTRKSLLAKMLEDILDTRFMVKSTMKFLDETMQKLYHNRQLALKLTANVTYGYASASFSGRMPCSDIADAIVQTARETLESAIRLIEENNTWGAKVVYGDTDSLFVYLPGKSKEEAFKIGKDIAAQVTESNPDPVVLKFEKVYHPSVLLAKKRYVGYSYESLDDGPKFDAKGIETVRRDGHFAQQYIVEKSLRILFDTANMTLLKSYIQNQFIKIMASDVSIHDFCFAKDVKIGHYKNPPPGAIVSMKKIEVDGRAEPQYKERVPYVIVKNPGKILRERAVSPEDFIKYNHELDSTYYIEKTLIPPLERIFNLMGVDIRQWYNDIPKKITKHLLIFKTDNCLVCGSLTKRKLCEDCAQDQLSSVLNLRLQMKDVESKLKETILSCRQTCDSELPCESFDCPNYYKRIRYMRILAEQDKVKKEIKW